MKSCRFHFLLSALILRRTSRPQEKSTKSGCSHCKVALCLKECFDEYHDASKSQEHNKEISGSGTGKNSELDGQTPNASMLLPVCVATVTTPAADE